MSVQVFLKLFAIFIVIAIGWGAAKTRALGGEAAARTMSNAAFFLFVPALLFRTTARVALADLPWETLASFFGPVVAVLLAVYGWQRVARGGSSPATPAVRAITATFGNGLQLGLPVVTALFGTTGLTVHIAIISMHALTLMTIVTVLVELDLARAQAAATGRSTVLATAAVTARRAVIHPVVLPVLLGLGWNLLGVRLPGQADDILATLSQAVAPVCLVTIGMSLAHYGVKGVLGWATTLAMGKLLVQPAVVFVIAHWVGDLHGVTLATVVMFAGLPVGSNALLFAQRYGAQEAEVTASIMVSTLAFTATAPLWLFVTSSVAP